MTFSLVKLTSRNEIRQNQREVEKNKRLERKKMAREKFENTAILHQQLGAAIKFGVCSGWLL